MSPQPGQKTVLITGCSPGGIGHEMCKAFHDRGLHVIATARNLPVLADFASQSGYTCLELDVTNEASIAACKKAVEQLTGGRLDILVNNAGRTHTVPATDLSLPDVRVTLETNVLGVMAMVAAFVPLLLPTRGLILNISSAASIVPYPFAAAYSASKAAVNAYSRTLRQELRPYGVRVMVAVTGTVRTNINNSSVQRPPLAPDSLYAPIADVYRWRLTFSRTARASVEADVYARRLVADCLRPEGWVWCRNWGLGLWRPDWHYFGGMARLVWWGSVVGEWLGDVIVYRMFKLHLLERIVRDRESKKID